MKTISELVDILYCNIDSILVSESDCLKLKELGYINQDEFGKFKEEHVFTKFAIESPRKWSGITESGEKVCRPRDFTMNFDEFAFECL